jgi:hypothetical protein
MSATYEQLLSVFKKGIISLEEFQAVANDDGMTCAQVIQKHYGLNREITDHEVIDELVNLRRKEKKGNLDDMQQELVNELQIRGMFSCKK